MIEIRAKVWCRRCQTDELAASPQAGKGAEGLGGGWRRKRAGGGNPGHGPPVFGVVSQSSPGRARHLPREVQPPVHSGPRARGTSGTQVFGLQSGNWPAGKGSLSSLPLTPDPRCHPKNNLGVVAVVRRSQMATPLLPENPGSVGSPLSSLSSASFCSCRGFQGKGLGGSEPMFPTLRKQANCLIRTSGVRGVRIPQKSRTSGGGCCRQCCKETLSFIGFPVLRDRNFPLGACGPGCGRRGPTGYKHDWKKVVSPLLVLLSKRSQTANATPYRAHRRSDFRKAVARRICSCLSERQSSREARSIAR